MKIKILLLLLLQILIRTDFAISQTNKKLMGEITDTKNKKIDGAVVALLKQKDSTLVKTVLTEADGKFEFINIKPETYFLSVSIVGYQKYSHPSFIIDEAQTEVIIPTIQLNFSDATQLKEVSIASSIPFVEKKLDRTIVNPDALISNAGINALEVLEKSPGIQVDFNGNISLKGRQGVAVYIDDKPTYLSAEDLANYLKSLPSSSLGLIEIMTNPPAKYDAAGNAGVINIKLKKTKAEGFNGGINTSYGQGFYARNNNSINFNYRINKINLFTNASYNINNNYQDLTINREYFNQNPLLNSTFNQNTFIKMRNNNANVKLGLDYYLNKKSTFGIVLSGFQNIARTNTDNIAILRNADKELQNTVNAINPSERNFKNGSANVNYNYKIDTLGKELTFNMDYLKYDSKLDQSLLSNTYLPDNTIIGNSNLLSNLPAEIDIKTAKVDFVSPLKNGANFETGLKTSLINTNNIANFFDETNNVVTINNEFSNNFKYKENINAAYVNYNIEKNKLAVQLGLRYENTSIEGNQLGNQIRNDSSFVRDYNSLFPTLYISYQLDTLSNNQIGFSYGRRIDRPDYQDLNPFTYPLDRFTLYAGNPFLKPTFSDNFELSHTYKNNITTTFVYSITKDIITETIEQNTNIFYSRPGNLGKAISYGVSVNGTIPLKKWWTIPFYTEVTNNSYKATLYNQNLDNSGTYWYCELTNQFQINDSWNAEISGNYQTRVVYGQFITIPVFTMRAGASKKILKKNGTIKVNINDLFYTNRPGGDIKSLNNSTANWDSIFDSRVFTISFSYRFNKGQSLAARTTGASDTEKTRVK